MRKQIYQQVHDLHTQGWWWGRGRNRMVVDLIRSMRSDFQGDRVLDVGCSEGAFLEYLSEFNKNFLAVDCEKTAIDFCCERGLGAHVRFGDVLNLPFSDSEFDIITALDIVEHVEQDFRAVSELIRVCKTGGLLFLIVPAHQWLWSKNDIAVHHYRRYSQKSFKELISQFPVQVKKFSYFNMILFPIFVLVSLFGKFSKNSQETNYLVLPPFPFNSLFRFLLAVESCLMVRLGMSLPFGSSIIAVLQKK